jgi:hypothetical protein
VLGFKVDRPTPGEVGKWLSRQKDKVFGDLRLSSKMDNHKKAIWTVRKLGQSVNAGVIRCQPGPFPYPARDLAEAGEPINARVLPNKISQGETTPADASDTGSSHAASEARMCSAPAEPDEFDL